MRFSRVYQLWKRLRLLDWAESVGAWIIEDDYDSEYRYRGRPISALQGLDSGARVLYMGTFSKTMFPALRIAYLVVPPLLVSTFRSATVESRKGEDGARELDSFIAAAALEVVPFDKGEDFAATDLGARL